MDFSYQHTASQKPSNSTFYVPSAPPPWARNNGEHLRASSAHFAPPSHDVSAQSCSTRLQSSFHSLPFPLQNTRTQNSVAQNTYRTVAVPHQRQPHPYRLERPSYCPNDARCFSSPQSDVTPYLFLSQPSVNQIDPGRRPNPHMAVRQSSDGVSGMRFTPAHHSFPHASASPQHDTPHPRSQPNVLSTEMLYEPYQPPPAFVTYDSSSVHHPQRQWSPRASFSGATSFSSPYSNCNSTFLARYDRPYLTHPSSSYLLENQPRTHPTQRACQPRNVPPPPTTAPPVCSQHFGLRSSPVGSMNTYCSVCDKGFTSVARYKQHVQEDHCSCDHPGCSFSAPYPILEAHKLKHIRGSNECNLFDDPDEIQRWIEARRRRFPSKNNPSLRSQADEQHTMPCAIERVLRSRFFAQNQSNRANLSSALVPQLRSLLKRQRRWRAHLVSKEQGNLPGRRHRRAFEFTTSELVRDFPICEHFLKFKSCKWNPCHFSHDIAAYRRWKVQRNLRGLDIPMRPPLLYQLLLPEIRKSEAQLLAALKYIVAHNFFRSHYDEQTDPVLSLQSEKGDAASLSSDSSDASSCIELTDDDFQTELLL